MATTEEVLQLVANSPKESNVLDMLTDLGIAWRSWTTAVLIDLYDQTKQLHMSAEERRLLELRIGFLVRYIKDLEFKATA